MPSMSGRPRSRTTRSGALVAQAMEEGFGGAEQLRPIAEFFQGVGDQAGDGRFVFDHVDEFGACGC
jgi:hypothetical protein